MKLPKGVYPGEHNDFGLKGARYFRNSGVKRCPKKGEHFLSGAIVTAYAAKNDMTTEYLIATEVFLVDCMCCGGTGKSVSAK